ncbi:MAG: hypothetical protein II805_04785 [Candidatus Methanomethylophilus sp.]|nr:hypothetical protein [Methanomethylophilus sp.]
MYVSKSINRRAAAILAAVFMVCTAFVVLADNSEASAYDDAKAFGEYVNPHEAAAPGAFTRTFEGNANLSGTYQNETILVKAGTALNLGNVPVIVKDSKIYFEVGADITISEGGVSFQGDYQVVLGYQENVSNGFTVDTEGDAALYFLNMVSRDHNTDCVLSQVPGTAVFRGMVGFDYQGMDFTVSSYRDNLVSFSCANGDWRMYIPIFNNESTPIPDLELKKEGSAYTCRSISGDANVMLFSMMLDPHTMAVSNPDVTINTEVSGNVAYNGQTIRIDPGFTVAAGTVISLTDCTVVFSPGTYNFANAFQLKLLQDTSANCGINNLVFGDATLYDLYNEDSDNIADIPVSQLTVSEHGFSLNLSDKMPITLSTVPGDVKLTINGTNDADIAFSATDRYNWSLTLKSYAYTDAGNGSLSLKCVDGKGTYSKDIVYVGEDGKVEMTADEVATIKASAAADPDMEVTFKIDDKYTVVMNSPALQALSSNAATLEVKDTTADQSALTNEQKAAIGDRPVFTISFGDNTNFGTGTVTVTVPYALKSGENPNGIYVAYVAADGTLEKLPTVYNSADGTVTFTTTHFSVFSIMSDLSHGEISPVVMAAAALTAAVVGALVAIVIRSGRY